MERRILGYVRDEEGDLVAHLDCGHGYHLRHRPPFFDRPWTLTPSGREAHIGAALFCQRCERLEVPDSFEAYKQTLVFDQDSIPAGLRANHHTKQGVWARIQILEGRLRYIVAPPLARVHILVPGRDGIVAPEVRHRIEPLGPVRLRVVFLRGPRE